jgi:hypothetical protein
MPNRFEQYWAAKMRQYPFTLNVTDLIIILGEVKEEGSRNETLDKPHPSALCRHDRVTCLCGPNVEQRLTEGMFSDSADGMVPVLLSLGHQQ